MPNFARVGPSMAPKAPLPDKTITENLIQNIALNKLSFIQGQLI